MSGVHLTGLEGTNPLGFLAALGVQVAFVSEPEQPRLWWSDDVVPHAVVDGDFSVDRIACQAMKVFARWKESSAVNPRRPDGCPMPKGDELKLTRDDTRVYLSIAEQCDSAGALATALVAEGSLDRKGDVAKPSDFYFTAGQQKLLDTVRKVLEETTRDDVLNGLEGPWRYESELPSLGWDVSDDRLYALRANNPSPEKKLTNPGPEALAVLGLSACPVFGRQNRTLTQGCSGSWKNGTYSWPLWRKPASPYGVKSLLAHAYSPDSMTTDRGSWFRSWGVFRVLQSSVHRSDQGGYGTFSPPEVEWQSQRY